MLLSYPCAFLLSIFFKASYSSSVFIVFRFLLILFIFFEFADLLWREELLEM